MANYGKVSALRIWLWAVIWCTLAGSAIIIIYSLITRYVPILLRFLPLPFTRVALLCFAIALLALTGSLLLVRSIGMTFGDVWYMMAGSHRLTDFVSDPVAATSQSQTADGTVSAPSTVAVLKLSALTWTVGSDAYCVLTAPHKAHGKDAVEGVQSAFKAECDSMLPGYRSAGSTPFGSTGISWHYYLEDDEDDDLEAGDDEI